MVQVAPTPRQSPSQPLAAAPRSLAVVVARASVERSIDFRAYPPPELFVSRGGEVAVRFPYRFRERSGEKDHWRFFLDCRSGKDHPAAVVQQRTDVPAATDQGEGVLERRFQFGRRGSYVIEFELGVDYMRSGWKSGEIEHWENRISSGSVVVQVV